MTQRRAALLRMHRDLTPNEERFKAVLLKPDQSEDYDQGGGTRKWLWPHLGTDYHLFGFIDVEEQQ